MNPATLAVDVRATFTDVVRLSEGGQLTFGKVLTTPARPTEGVIAASHRADTPLSSVAVFNHGTTLGLNALLTRTGARTAVMARQSFRDLCLLGRTARKTNHRKPPGLLERADTAEVRERVLHDSSVHALFDEPDARRVAEAIRDRGHAAVEVAFLHAYAIDAQEKAMRAILADVDPSIHLSLCSDLLREHREYERTSTSCSRRLYHADRAHQPARAEQGAGGTRSGGGAMTATTARELPVNLILSGPVGHVIRSRGVLEDRRRFRPGDDRYAHSRKVWEGTRCQLR